ncbi:MAG: hypothetical protein LBT35_02985, partial [Tannerella sp.]|nr:hypothetical protein [Tannerella sp.]
MTKSGKNDGDMLGQRNAPPTDTTRMESASNPEDIPEDIPEDNPEDIPSLQDLECLSTRVNNSLKQVRYRKETCSVTEVCIIRIFFGGAG